MCAGELASRGYEVTVYDERDEVGGLVRYAIAPYRQVREPLPQEARRSSAIGVDVSGWARRSAREELEGARSSDATPSSSASAWARTRESATLATNCPGVWDSLPFIEAIKTGVRPASAPGSS